VKDKKGNNFRLHDLDTGQDRFLEEILTGLQKPQKELPSKYFYDEHGSYLFNCICNLEEYYIPHTEKTIMDTHIDEMTALIGSNILLVEYGSGRSTKTKTLLTHLDKPSAYIPIDISREQLLQASEELSDEYPHVEILPVCADYTTKFKLPSPSENNQRIVVYFPGSSIGNFEPATAIRFLKQVADVCKPGGGLLIGVDLKKDSVILNDAYNDRRGITAAFNLNLLQRINRELGSDFDIKQFRHYAFYNSREGRIEMHLVSLTEQMIHLDSTSIPFRKGESIWTENSYKYSIDEFCEIASAAGFKVRHVWTDEKQWFSVYYLLNTR